MARLTARQRRKIPSRDFAGPGRSFPVNDASHARAAIRMAPRSYHAGNISKSTEKRIVSRAKRRLHRK